MCIRDSTDVEVPYGDIVAIGHGHAEFIAHCEAALALTPTARAAMATQMRAVVARTSWDGTADQMHALIEDMRADTPARLPGHVAALAVEQSAAIVVGVPNYGEPDKINPLRPATSPMRPAA